MISRIKGTNDFCDLTFFNTVVDQFKLHIALYNFHEIATPILEPFELFHRSLGEFTDVVSKEMFFIQSHNPHDRICLRPEATAATVRAFIENKIAYTPWKVFSYGPMFRYERPQKGRFRQFHQINIEIIGSSSHLDDVQLMYMLDQYFSHKLLLTDYTLALNYVGCIQDRITYTKKLVEFLHTASIASHICAQCTVRAEKNSMRVFDCKNEQCQTLYNNAPSITDHLCTLCTSEWTSLQMHLTSLSVSFVHNKRLVRGLDYYQKTVFEFSSPHLGAQNAFCGGGRYDSLVKDISGKQDQPSIGAAIGIERLILLLEAQTNSLHVNDKKLACMIIPLALAYQPVALLVAKHIRDQGISTDISFLHHSVKNMMRAADRASAAFAIIIGQTEYESMSATVKNMQSGEQITMLQTEVASYIKKQRVD